MVVGISLTKNWLVVQPSPSVPLKFTAQRISPLLAFSNLKTSENSGSSSYWPTTFSRWVFAVLKSAGSLLRAPLVRNTLPSNAETVSGVGIPSFRFGKGLSAKSSSAISRSAIMLSYTSDTGDLSSLELSTVVVGKVCSGISPKSLASSK